LALWVLSPADVICDKSSLARAMNGPKTNCHAHKEDCTQKDESNTKRRIQHTQKKKNPTQKRKIQRFFFFPYPFFCEGKIIGAEVEGEIRRMGGM
jgi:hypothetical protein